MIQGLSLKELDKVFLSGVKNAVPAVLVLCVAYPLNTLSSEMGTADFLVSITGSVLPPALLPFVIFVLAAILSFATGTSWGTYAICVPLFLPLAFRINNGQFNAYLLACFGILCLRSNSILQKPGPVYLPLSIPTISDMIPQEQIVPEEI